MKKLLLLLAAMLLSLGIAAAQTQNNPNANTPTTDNSQTQTTTTTTRHARTNKKGNLTQTASPLPLLGLLGMGSLAAGVATRKKNRS